MFINLIVEILDGSFAENFYGLKRVLLNDKHLTDSHRKLSFLYIVVLPYLRRKLEEKVSEYKLEQAEGFVKNVQKKCIL